MKKLYNTIPNTDKQPEPYIKEGFVLKADNSAKYSDNMILNREFTHQDKVVTLGNIFQDPPKDSDNMVLNGEFTHQNKVVTLGNIFQDPLNAWINKWYNLEYDYKKKSLLIQDQKKLRT